MGALMGMCRGRKGASPFHAEEFEVSEEWLAAARQQRVRIVCVSETHRFREGVQLLGAQVPHQAPLNLSYELFHSVAKPSESAKDKATATRHFQKLALSFDLRDTDLILVYAKAPRTEQAFSFVRLFRQYGH